MEICKICKEEFETKQKLGMHVRFKHNMLKKDYYIKFMYNNEIPKCKCGCEREVSYIPTYPYFREYISGHNKSTLGYKFSKESKNKMRKSAIKRIKNYNGKLPMHNIDAIKKRSKIYSDNYMKIKAKKFNIDIIDRNLHNITFKCLKCNNIYKQNHTSYFICEYCNPKIRSNAESEIFSFLHDELKLITIHNNRSLIKGIELDMTVDNIAIEYNGLYLHSENGGNKDKTYHINKMKLCNENNVKLINIFEDEWKFKSDIVKSRLKNILNVNNSPKIYARNCIIKEIDVKIKNDFLEKNHIQGKDISSIYLGCFYKDKLVSVMTFGKPRVVQGYKNINDKEYELIRFCSDVNCLVIGSSGKLLKYFIKNYLPKKIITYSDNRWSNLDKSMYEKIGFIKTSNGEPNYWYTTYKFDRLHRFNFTKKKLVNQGYDKNLTEWQIMQNLKYDRIWDCGSSKYEMVLL